MNEQININVSSHFKFSLAQGFGLLSGTIWHYPNFEVETWTKSLAPLASIPISVGLL